MKQMDTSEFHAMIILIALGWENLSPFIRWRWYIYVSSLHLL